MTTNNFLQKLFSLPDKEREILIAQIEKLCNCHTKDDNSSFSCIEKIRRILSDKDNKSNISQWRDFGHLSLFKNGNNFIAIETLRFKDNYIGAVYEFDIELDTEIVDYQRIAENSELEFPSDLYLYQLAYGKARILQLEDAIAIKLTNNINELYLWKQTWRRIDQDI